MMIFPRKVHLLLANLLGFLFLMSRNKRNKYSKINIEICFPELSQQERNSIYRKNIISSGKVLFDTGSAWFWSNRRINKNIPYKINGLEDLINEQRQKNGVLLFFKHSLHLELDARILGLNAELYGVEREHNSRYFQSIQKNGRQKSMKAVIDRKNILGFIRLLKNGKTLLYAPDQDYGMRNSNEIKFFNRPAATINAPLKIIQNTHCKTFFLNSYIANGVLIMDIEKLELDHSSVLSFSKNLNKYIEDKIRLSPHEYLWQHRRFKSTLGKDNIYK
tara:strand:- start:723 stop:1550 length:828 start_codon:yes stop_codon:yes gene_type:complete